VQYNPRSKAFREIRLIFFPDP